jgi:predicted dehydrogenase
MLARGCIVGLGTMGTHHLRVLSGMAEATVVAVVDPAEERREAVQARHPQIDVLPSLEKALERHELEFVGLAAPVAQLPELALQCIAASVPVLIEKPMGPTEEAAAEVLDAGRAAGVLLSVGYVERYNPAVVALKKLLDEGAIGRVLQFHARRLSPAPLRESMFGVSLDLATHDIDVMRYLAGSEVTRVFAETAQRRNTRDEDLLCATLRFHNDATGLLEVNWITPTKVRQLYVTGENGMFVVDYLQQDLSFFEHPRLATEWEALEGMRGSGEGDMTRYALPRREPLAVEWESFFRAMAGEDVPLVRGDDGLAAIRIARAIQESGRLHEAIRVSPPADG